MANSSPPNVTAVIAIDKSEQAKQAFNYYLEYIHKAHNKIILVHVIELPDVETYTEIPEVSAADLASRWQMEKADAIILERQFLSLAEERQIDNVTVKRKNGTKPGESIVKCAKEYKASLVVMGTRGMGVIKRTLLGSVSDYVVHHCSCPVIIYRHHEN